MSPPNHPLKNRVFHCKPSNLGYHYCWKHPYRIHIFHPMNLVQTSRKNKSFHPQLLEHFSVGCWKNLSGKVQHFQGTKTLEGVVGWVGRGGTKKTIQGLSTLSTKRASCSTASFWVRLVMFWLRICPVNMSMSQDETTPKTIQNPPTELVSFVGESHGRFICWALEVGFT